VQRASIRVGPLVVEAYHSSDGKWRWHVEPFEASPDDTWEVLGVSPTLEKAQEAAKSIAEKLR